MWNTGELSGVNKLTAIDKEEPSVNYQYRV